MEANEILLGIFLFGLLICGGVLAVVSRPLWQRLLGEQFYSARETTKTEPR
jgi:hypothetical protein